jgi:hypothetical protein
LWPRRRRRCRRRGRQSCSGRQPRWRDYLSVVVWLLKLDASEDINNTDATFFDDFEFYGRYTIEETRWIIRGEIIFKL